MRIEDFVQWPSGLAVCLDRTREVVPDDPRGAIVAGRTATAAHPSCRSDTIRTARDAAGRLPAIRDRIVTLGCHRADRG
ncbi:hypothetical protein [Streptomyces sp. NPDC018833]|uniref:hypothetical protein n=1 Tax=Streptomyces sp. NPDC018833 TaxID=3365053 RepID=UPI0037B57F61